MSDYEHWRTRDLVVEIAENVSKLLRRVAALETKMTEKFDELSAQLAELEASNARLVAANARQNEALMGIQNDVTFLKENIPTTGAMTDEEVQIIRDRVTALNASVTSTVNAEESQTASAEALDAQTDPNAP